MFEMSYFVLCCMIFIRLVMFMECNLNVNMFVICFIYDMMVMMSMLLVM